MSWLPVEQTAILSKLSPTKRFGQLHAIRFKLAQTQPVVTATKSHESYSVQPCQPPMLCQSYEAERSADCHQFCSQHGVRLFMSALGVAPRSNKYIRIHSPCSQTIPRLPRIVSIWSLFSWEVNVLLFLDFST